MNKFVKSNSEKYLEAKSSQPPQISALVASSVSEERRNMLADDVASGIYRDGSSTNLASGETANANVVASVRIAKHAQVLSGGQFLDGGVGPGSNYRGGMGDSVKQVPQVYSPLWLNSNLNLPRDRVTINAWCRSFYALNPFVHNAINLHSTYPISKLNIKCKNAEIQQFFDEMIENLDLINICTQIAQEYFLLGEAFVYGELDNTKGMWSRLLIENPDYMIVKRTVVANEPIIMMRPDENLKRIINSNRPADLEQKKQLNQYIIDAVKRGENIVLDNFHIHHLARKISPYEIRGTGLPVCIFRQLMLFDQLREAKYVQAVNMINPMTIVKIGSADYKPTHLDLEAWRNVFEAAQYDQDFKIFTHEGVAVERVGWNQGIYDISGDITQLMKEIYVGLQVPQVLMDGGADTTYANGGVALDVLRQRYMQFRNMLGSWLRNKIFAPISKIQGFYEYKDKKKRLIVPEIDWNHMSLFDTADYIQNLVTLTSGKGEEKRASLHSLYRAMGLEWEDEVRKKRKEMIQAAIETKEAASLEKMPLNALRSLGDGEDNEIPEPDTQDAKEAPVPGETGAGEEAAGGGMPPMSGLPGLGGSGSPPPLPSPPPAGGAGGPPPPPPPAGGPPPAAPPA